MGRPWWYDSYWDKKQPRRRRRQAFSRRTWVWLGILLLSLLLAGIGNGFSHSWVPWVRGFVDNACRILSLAVLVRAILSWFPVGGYNTVVFFLDDATEPLLFPLRRVVPLVGRFDLTPLVAILLLMLIPVLVGLALP